MKNILHGEPGINKIIGMDTKKAVKQLKTIGYTMRVVNKDGSPYMVTADHNIKRVNVFVNENIVTDIDGIG